MAAILVTITTRSAQEAETIGLAAVVRRLAASAQIEPIAKTIYRWKGSVEEHEEHRLTLFTRPERWDALVSLVVEMHSYELPQVVASPIVLGSAAFLAWIEENSSEAEAPIG